MVKDDNRSNEIGRESSLKANIAPLIVYGTTVAIMGLVTLFPDIFGSNHMSPRKCTGSNSVVVINGVEHEHKCYGNRWVLEPVKPKDNYDRMEKQDRLYDK